MKKNIYGKGINRKMWYSMYINDAIIDIFNMLTKKNLEILLNLEIIIEDRLYTEQEFDIIKFNTLKYYETNENDEIIQTELLTERNVKKEDYLKILNIFNIIDKKYDL